jgi:hypothetical protein
VRGASPARRSTTSALRRARAARDLSGHGDTRGAGSPNLSGQSLTLAVAKLFTPGGYNRVSATILPGPLAVAIFGLHIGAISRKTQRFSREKHGKHR